MHAPHEPSDSDDLEVDTEQPSLRPMCPVARSIIDEVRARLDWEARQRSRATCPPRVRYTDS